MTTTTQQRRDQLAGWYDLATKVIGKHIEAQTVQVYDKTPELVG